MNMKSQQCIGILRLIKCNLFKCYSHLIINMILSVHMIRFVQQVVTRVWQLLRCDANYAYHNEEMLAIDMRSLARPILAYISNLHQLPNKHWWESMFIIWKSWYIVFLLFITSCIFGIFCFRILVEETSQMWHVMVHHHNKSLRQKHLQQDNSFWAEHVTHCDAISLSWSRDTLWHHHFTIYMSQYHINFMV